MYTSTDLMDYAFNIPGRTFVKGLYQLATEKMRLFFNFLLKGYFKPK